MEEKIKNLENEIKNLNERIEFLENELNYFIENRETILEILEKTGRF